MILIGCYEVRYDQESHEYVLDDKEGQRGETRRDTIIEIAGLIEDDIFEQSVDL